MPKVDTCGVPRAAIGTEAGVFNRVNSPYAYYYWLDVFAASDLGLRPISINRITQMAGQLAQKQVSKIETRQDLLPD